MAEPIAFETPQERRHRVPNAGPVAAALQINADADPLALVVAALSRASTVSTALDLWSVAGDADVTAAEVAESIAPTAAEVLQLLQHLAKLLHEPQGASG